MADIHLAILACIEETECVLGSWEVRWVEQTLQDIR